MSLSHGDYTVGCICPMGVELAPVKAMLDPIHPSLSTQRDLNSYILGDMCGHNVAIAVLPEIGNNAAAASAVQLLNDFPSIRFGLLVGIGGGLPGGEDDGQDIRLGDVVISKPTATFGGVVQYDLGKYTTANGFERTGMLAKPPPLLRSSVENLAADHRIKGSQVPRHLREMLQHFPAMEEDYSHPGLQHDQLFRADYPHSGGASCRHCDMKQTIERDSRKSPNPKFYYGTIGSANMVVKDAEMREKLRRSKILCVEMEAAGLMDSFPCLVVRGICDYADSHKNKRWQPYAAATAAAYMKELLSVIPAKDVTRVAPATEVVRIPTYERGVNLFDAPEIANELFIGRATDMQKMEDILLPSSKSALRRRLILGGMGGIGKTQLSIAYAKRHGNAYSSVFWLNATSELTLQSSIRKLAPRIVAPETVARLDNDRLWIEVSNWLSEPQNSHWLLIFDNYDNPDEFDIAQYYPSDTHGSLIVTTRVPSKVNGSRVDLGPLGKEGDSLQVLSTRSGRTNTVSGNERDGLSNEPVDVDAQTLARRLDGHPLALATGGSYLKECPWSFAKYLRFYEERWAALASSEQLKDYPSRTLHTTWDIFFQRIKQENELAAELLNFLAYLDHRDIWYDLFSKFPYNNAPLWFTQLTEDELSFGIAMKTLVRYCLVQANHQNESYSIHVCVHDWTLNMLNHQINANRYWLAFDCVAGHIYAEEVGRFASIQYGRITAHAERLASNLFENIAEPQVFEKDRLLKISYLGVLLYEQAQYRAAERMLKRALARYEIVLGRDNVSTLNTINELGGLYAAQGRPNEAEEMSQQALVGFERLLGDKHESTLTALTNLGRVYQMQGRLKEAEEVIQRAFQIKKDTLGLEHRSTLLSIQTLGVIYLDLWKLDQAAEMYHQALQGYEKMFGPKHRQILDLVNELGRLYHRQGEIDKAEAMFQRALQGWEETAGAKHTLTLAAVNNLGGVYIEQGKSGQGEEFLLRALQGEEKKLGVNHTVTLQTVSRLGGLYNDQGRWTEAEEMFQRALRGYEDTIGLDHLSALHTVNNLGFTYDYQGKMDQAEEMYQRALRGYEKNIGPERLSTYSPALNTCENLGNLYTQQVKQGKAKEMFQRALAGLQQVLGPSHERCQSIERFIERLDLDQGTDPFTRMDSARS
ncbi:hypothetical protein LTR44_005975 [Exophiala sp. CCFEE 6388]|nr:hypothetical protein LTR44_005975 [Eurotiomycetes sp. CCFEE 6388]